MQVYVDMYNVSSRGSAHILSGDALIPPAWDTGLFSDPEDLKNLVRVFRVSAASGHDCRSRSGGTRAAEQGGTRLRHLTRAPL
jgi:hypothetical protein